MVGPTPSTSASAAAATAWSPSSTARSAVIEPNRVASARAAIGPTFRKREPVRSFLYAQISGLNAPLTNRLGIHSLKGELEDLSLQYLEPDAYKDILSRLEETTKAKQNPKAVYYHLLRLKEAGILARRKGRYYLGDGEKRSLGEIFRGIYMKKADGAFSNIAVALEKLENGYR